MAKPSDNPDADGLEKARQIYGAYMVEIKARLYFIQTAIEHIRAEPKREHGYIDAESAILQLRTICECMGLAALALHSYAHPTEHLEQTWRVREIFGELKKINQHCFPRPWRFVGKTDKELRFDASEGELPTLRGLMRCYGRCARLLHRGEIAQAFDATWKTYDIDWIEEWATRLGELLVHHVVMDLDGENSFVFITQLYGGPKGEVTVEVAQATGPSKLNEPPRVARFPRQKKR